MAFRFPSLSAVIKGAFDTLKRFPLTLACAIVASGISIYMLELKWDEQKKYEYLWKIVMCCWLGLNLFLSMSLISERRNHNVIQKYAIQFFGLILIVGYYFLLPEFRRITLTDG